MLENICIGAALSGAEMDLHPEDFTQEDAKEAWKVIQENPEADMITIGSLLEKETGKNHMKFLSTCMRSTFSVKNAKQYADQLREKGTLRRLNKAAISILEKTTTCSDSSDAMKHAHDAILGVEISDPTQGPAHVSKSLSGFIDELETRFNNGGEIVGLPSGYKDLDNLTNGFLPGQLIILAARPAMGKTTLALNIAEHASMRAGKTALVFSMEMSSQELIQRASASVGRVDFSEIRSGKVVGDSWPKITNSVARLKESKLHIDDTPALQLHEMKKRARRVQREHGLDVIVVDYLGLMRGDGENRTQEITKISGGLKAMAKEIGVPVIALSQLSRKCEERADKRPMCSDLRESGSIEQDADTIMFLYRDEIYNPDTQNKGVVELKIAKQRNGETGTVYLADNLKQCRFEDFTGTVHQEQKFKGNSGFNY